MRVLVVEDNVLNQEVASYVLEHAGAQVDLAANGRVAVDMLAAARDGASAVSPYDAVLMDLQMPVMDGFEATAAIRAMGLDALPVVAMTANAMEEDRERALAAGMDAHVAKPIDVDGLVATLARLWRGSTAGPPGAVAGAPMPVPPRLPGIDLKATLTRFDGSFATFAGLFKRFAATHRGAVDEIRTLLDGGNRGAASQAAHRLRGVAANLGAADVAQHAFELEGALRTEDADALAARLAKLDAALQIVLQAARELDAPAQVGIDAGAGAGARTADAGPDPTLHAQRAALAQLLDLLQNNNMKAMAYFASLRPALSRLAPAQVAPLADAVATLRFDAAAQLVLGMLDALQDGEAA
jgi:two-component system sensor histidine kinase/response regulator